MEQFVILNRMKDLLFPANAGEVQLWRRVPSQIPDPF